MAPGFSAPASSDQAPSNRKGIRPEVDAEQIQRQWGAHFERLEDPRGLQGQSHAFLSIVLMAIFATIGGATGWADSELYVESHQERLATFFDLSHGILPADTYRRVLERNAV